MSFTEVFINAEHAAKDNFIINEGDYIGEDGVTKRKRLLSHSAAKTEKWRAYAIAEKPS